jgi:hypothetical protein
VLIPPAYGLRDVALETYTGEGPAFGRVLLVVAIGVVIWTLLRRRKKKQST